MLMVAKKFQKGRKQKKNNFQVIFALLKINLKVTIL